MNKQENQCTSIDKAPKGIPLERIIELRKKNLTYEEIGTILNCSKQNIEARLKGIKEHLDSLESFKANKADLMALNQSVILNSLTPDVVKSASPYQRVGMLGILFDKERLERNQVTEIIGYMDYNRALDQVMAERNRLREELGLDEGSDEAIDVDYTDGVV